MPPCHHTLPPKFAVRAPRSPFCRIQGKLALPLLWCIDCSIRGPPNERTRFRQFLEVVQRHIGQGEFNISSTGSSATVAGHGESDDVASKIREVFKQMDVRGDGDVCWEDFSTVREELRGNV